MNPAVAKKVAAIWCRPNDYTDAHHWEADLTNALDSLARACNMQPPGDLPSIFARICADPECETKLSIYNKGTYCAKHEPPEHNVNIHLGLHAGPTPTPTKQHRKKCARCLRGHRAKGDICRSCKRDDVLSVAS